MKNHIVYVNWVNSKTGTRRAKVLRKGLNRDQAERAIADFERSADDGWKPVKYKDATATAEDISFQLRESDADRFWISCGEIHDSPVTNEQIERCAEDSAHGLENLGICVHCGDEHHGIEPDARGMKCDQCGRHSVYGAQELMICFHV